MATTRRRQPKRLARKLRAIRQRLEFSQTQMAKALDLKVAYTVVSAFERGKQEPDLLILSRYAKLARVPVETLIDDELKLSK
jgi:transcriptional regulator with XRE-family HTH domain